LGQEFIIKSQTLEDKINQLLPSQGGFAAGVDLSASTQIVPIVDLTESAEGSNLRQDLQSAFTLVNCNAFFVSNSTSTLITTPGFYKIAGNSMLVSAAAARTNSISITDGITSKLIYSTVALSGGTAGEYVTTNFDVMVKLEAGDSLSVTAATNSGMGGSVRQIADLDGNLINP
jgi:hypothetical protein